MTVEGPKGLLELSKIDEINAENRFRMQRQRQRMQRQLEHDKADLYLRNCLRSACASTGAPSTADTGAGLTLSLP